MSGSRYASYVEKLKESVTRAPGELGSDVRAAILERDVARIPAELVSYVTKVVQHAHRITDEDVLALKRQGLSEDRIFEATAAAAVGAALYRLEKATAALRAS